MRNKEFVAFILTHGRPDKVHTYDTLAKAGYTGRVIVLIDNEDETAGEYHRLFGDKVVVFDKAEVATRIDEADNFDNRKAILYARNACFDIAERLGIKYFIQLDDDYTRFCHRISGEGRYVNARVRRLDDVFDAFLDYYKANNFTSIALSQAGDFFGGEKCTNRHEPKRKSMNSFFCSTERRFKFSGRINEDVNAYVTLGSRGNVFLSVPHASLDQKTTQKSAGGMTGIYLDGGTYNKSFYSVIHHPSSVTIHTMGDQHPRIHHKVKWRNTVPRILPESARKK